MPIPARVRGIDAIDAVAAEQEWLVSARQCREAGVDHGVIRLLLRRGAWRRVTRGVYDVDPFPGERGSYDRRRRRAAWSGLLAYGPDAVAVGPSALALLGVSGLPVDVAPQVALPAARSLESRDGIRLRMFDDGMTVTRAGRAVVASPWWALAQAVPELDREHAVSVLDSAVHRGVVTVDEVAHAHDLARGRRGVARTHSWWGLADGRSESPLETRVRLDCHDGGVGPDALQVPLVDASGVVRRGDLGWRTRDGRWLVAEADGAEFHGSLQAAYADRARHNELVGGDVAGTLRFTFDDVRVAGRCARTVRRALHALGRRPR